MNVGAGVPDGPLPTLPYKRNSAWRDDVGIVPYKGCGAGRANVGIGPYKRSEKVCNFCIKMASWFLTSCLSGVTILVIS